MLRFEVYTNGEPAKGIDLSGAYVFGSEGLSVRADIVAAGNIITVAKQSQVAAGLAIMRKFSDQSAFLLATTRLPDRIEPYNLNVELARAQIMRIYRKWEDWFMFDYQDAADVSAEFRRIQLTFAEALKVNVSDPEKASLIADRALEDGLCFAEKLALFHADLLCQKRSDVTSDPVEMGLNVNIFAEQEQYRAVLNDSDFVRIPMPWSIIEQRKNKCDFSKLDHWVNYCFDNDLKIHAGPVLDLRDGFLPGWLSEFAGDYDKLKERIFNHTHQVVGRYASKVSLWSVFAGLEAVNAFDLSFDQLADLTRGCCQLMKKIAPDAELMIELIQPFGEYFARDQHTIPPVLFADLAYQSDLKFDSFGIPVHMGAAVDGFFVRDLMQISSLLDEFLPHGKNVRITACGVPSDFRPDKTDIWKGKQSIARAGYWHRKWCENLQEEWLGAIYRLAMSRPYIKSICWQDIADLPVHVIPHGGLLDSKLAPKPALKKFCLLADKNNEIEIL